jgi:predicted ATP-grasp superfamily ATP-dependent carboligase
MSTGINYIDDVLVRGYEPVLLEASYSEFPYAKELREDRIPVSRRLSRRFRIIPENDDYEEVLRQVREYDPVAVIPGSDYGVTLATRLAADLGLPGNPKERIAAMTRKQAMQEALRDYGIRYVRGEAVYSEEEAIRFYRELGKYSVVVKPIRGAGSTGVYLCCGEEEMLDAVHHHFTEALNNGFSKPCVLVQERIYGTEYVVNTVSCEGMHRISSVGMYEKHRLSNGSNAYSYFRYISKLGVGHSRLLNYACEVADAIGIKYGPVHGEYMVDENGPVLIEVNCRPMGGGLDRKYSELVVGHHETDVALDAYLDREKFLRDSRKPYRLHRCGISKDMVLFSDTEVKTAPILQICRRLKSFYSASYGMIGKTDFLPQTRDMETEAGLVYLVHDDELQVREDCELLRLLETKYPRILYQDWSYGEVTDSGQDDAVHAASVREYIDTEGIHGATLILSDTLDKAENATVVTTSTLSGAYDSFEYGILDLSRPRSFADLESVIQLIFVFMDKIRVGGHILVPESTYRNLPYGIEGMEILFKVSGMIIELPSASEAGMLVATVS